MHEQSDIEIYLDSVPIEALETWLVTLFNPVEEKSISGKTARYAAHYKGEEFTIVIVNRVTGTFSSVWFNSPHTPWSSDIECAKAAYEYFKKEVRCVEGGWEEGQDPDSWYSISDKGENKIIWRD